MVLFHKNIIEELNERAYHTMVRPTLLHSLYKLIKKTQVQKV